MLRFVPPGFLHDGWGSVAASTGGAPARSSTTEAGAQELIFFGMVDRFHPKRRKCFMDLKRALGHALVQRYDVWNASAFAELASSAQLFLNLHKHCGSRHPVTFRNSVLLNAHKSILSERAHCRDEREYRGMITFSSIRDLPATYQNLLRSDWRATQRAAYRSFAQRFAPSALFQRAGVYRDWAIAPWLLRRDEEEGSAVMYDGVLAGRHSPCSDDES